MVYNRSAPVCQHRTTIMDRTHGPEITFTVHPRPEVEEPIGHADPVPLPAGLKAAPSLPVSDEPDDKDTFLANLTFLARFAFGRY